MVPVVEAVARHMAPWIIPQPQAGKKRRGHWPLHMADIVSRETRSRMMAGIRSRDTKPELAIRRALHAMGYRYRLHGKLPGRPDLVFPSRNAVIFIHGCFWHGHDCPLFRLPGSRTSFWTTKIDGNRRRDAAALEALAAAGGDVLPSGSARCVASAVVPQRQ